MVLLGAVWRRTTISHVTTAGAFCLYACERTGEAIWIPSGDYFVADRSQETPTGTIMDYLVHQRRSDTRPTGYGFHRSCSTANTQAQRFGVQRPGPMRNHIHYLASRPYNRHDPLARPEPRPAGTGSQRTVSRRVRRDRASGVHQPVPPTPASLTPPPSTTPSTTTSPPNNTSPQTPMVFHNSDHNISGVAELHLSDEEDA